jgi:hypothetical protein
MQNFRHQFQQCIKCHESHLERIWHGYWTAIIIVVNPYNFSLRLLPSLSQWPKENHISFSYFY